MKANINTDLSKLGAAGQWWNFEENHLYCIRMRCRLVTGVGHIMVDLTIESLKVQ